MISSDARRTNSASVEVGDASTRIRFSLPNTARSIGFSSRISLATNPGTSTRWVRRTVATKPR